MTEPPVANLAERFAERGHELYLVGGSVRDLFLGRPPDRTDLDFTTDARPPEIKQILQGFADAVYTVGEAFGTIGAKVGDQIYEITTFRSEVYTDTSRKPEVAFGDSIEADLERRDFTVNAMAIRPGDAELAAIAEMGDRLQIVSAERIRDEFSKLITGGSVTEALLRLVESGLADQFIPEVPALAMEIDPQQRHKDVLAHSIAVTAKTSPDLELRLAALLHDIGKPATREFGPNGVTFHHHEVVGARMARARLRELRYPKQVVQDVGNLVFLHMRPHTFKMGWTDSAVRRYVRDAGHLLDKLNELVRCDVTTRNERRAREIQRRIDELEQRIAELREREELEALRPPIDGNDVMQYLGIAPGRTVGTVMRMLLEHRIEHGPYTPHEAFQLVREWAISEGLDDPGPPPA